MTEKLNIQWHLEKRKIKDLKDYSKNPRKISKHDADNLKNSLKEFGLSEKPIITQEGLIIGGHQRKRCIKTLGIKEVECWVPDIQLTSQQISKLNLVLNRVQGDFDYDILANEYDLAELFDAGFTQNDFSMNDVEKIVSQENNEEDNENNDDNKLKNCPNCGFNLDGN